jgi:hypothetical protein
MKIKEVITRAMSGTINWIQLPRFWACRTDNCGDGESDGKSMDMTACSTIGPNDRARNE